MVCPGRAHLPHGPTELIASHGASGFGPRWETYFCCRKSSEMRNLTQGKLEENILRPPLGATPPTHGKNDPHIKPRIIIVGRRTGRPVVGDHATQQHRGGVNARRRRLVSLQGDSGKYRPWHEQLPSEQNEKRSRTRDRSQSKDRSRNAKTRPRGEICFFHKKFGEAATRCKSPCS